MQVEIQWATVVTSLTIAALTWLAGRVGRWAKEGVERDKKLDAKLDALTRATQVNMRQSLIHTFEKYWQRGWVTPEERAAWVDTYEAYHGLGANGLIDTYRAKLDTVSEQPIGANDEIHAS